MPLGIYSPDMLLRSTTFYTSGKDRAAAFRRHTTINQPITQTSPTLASFLSYNQCW